MPHSVIENAMNFRLVKGPTDNPITKNRAKEFLRVSTSNEDKTINALITAATIHVERITGRLLLPQTWDLFMDHFPVERNQSRDWWDGVKEGPISTLMSRKRSIEIWKTPLQSVEFFKTFDRTDTEFIFPDFNFIVDNVNWPGRIVVRHNETWPTTDLRSANAIQIRMKFGYANVEEIPAPILEGLLLILGHLYENRGDEATTLKFPAAATMLLNNYTTRRL